MNLNGHITLYMPTHGIRPSETFYILQLVYLCLFTLSFDEVSPLFAENMCTRVVKHSYRLSP